MEKTFWIDGFEGEAMGGYFIRNGLFQFLETLESHNLKPVGIKVEDSWNLEVLVVKENQITENKIQGG